MSRSLFALGLFACIVIASAAPFVPNYRLGQFQAWKSQYGKSYATPKEETYRLAVFHENMNFIESHDEEAKGFGVGMLRAFLRHPLNSGSTDNSPQA